jgi:hypothetical protein
MHGAAARRTHSSHDSGASLSLAMAKQLARKSVTGMATADGGGVAVSMAWQQAHVVPYTGSERSNALAMLMRPTMKLSTGLSSSGKAWQV